MCHERWHYHLRNQAARRESEEGTCPPLDDSPHGSFGFVDGACPAPPVARLLQPANAHAGLCMPAVQQGTPVAAPVFPRTPSFRSFESTPTTTVMMPLSFFPPPTQPTWLAHGPVDSDPTKADTEGKIPFMAAAAVGLDATLEGNCDAWLATIDAAIFELGHNALGAVS
jgi:hypothetical protein